MTAWRRVFLGVLLALVLSVGVAWRQTAETNATREDVGRMVLLVPDGTPANAFFVQIWRDAASEQGVQLDAMDISVWVRQHSYSAAPGAGVIVPDTHHRRMGQTAILALADYVKNGGHLMLVQDGGLLDESGRYAEGPARLSQVVGAQYGDYDRWGDGMGRFLRVQGQASVFEDLQIPPGRYQPVKPDGSVSAMPTAEEWQARGLAQVSVYGNKPAHFPVLRTEENKGKVLLRTPEGDVVASLNRHGAGSALFVNMPLTHLRQQTDGVFLHGFIRMFARDVLGLPVLLPTPSNRGIFVLNWHNDDRLAIAYLHRLLDAGIFDHGHQSMHFTAGPDVDRKGDGKGMDLANNADAQNMIRLLAAQGHTIGNHGGWIHNYFGINASDSNETTFEPFLDLNNEAVKAANLGKQPIEYSAPMGNNPVWTFDWLKRHGNQAVYSTGDIGMAPTRLWMGNRRMGGGWAFPVLTNGGIASAEEAYFNQMAQGDFAAWLQEVARFVREQRVMRLSYFHPVGAVLYLEPVKGFVDEAQACANADACRFMSMTEAAEFLNRREAVNWRMQVESATTQWLTAQHDTSLNEMVWQLPREFFKHADVVLGNASVKQDDRFIYIAAMNSKELRIKLTMNGPSKHEH